MNNNSVGGKKKAVDRQKAALAGLAVGLILLGSLAVYQQLQLASLSATVSSQSSELSSLSGLVSSESSNLSALIQQQTIVAGQLGIRTWISSFVFNGSTRYSWTLIIANKGQLPIVGIRAVLNAPAKGPVVGEEDAFSILPGYKAFVGPPSQGSTTSLTPGATCIGGTGVELAAQNPSIGKSFPASITVTYTDGSASTVSVAVVVA